MVRLFRATGHSYDAGVGWLIAKFWDSFAYSPVGAALRRVTYRTGTLEQLDPAEAPSAKEALVVKAGVRMAAIDPVCGRALGPSSHYAGVGRATSRSGLRSSTASRNLCFLAGWQEKGAKRSNY